MRKSHLKGSLTLILLLISFLIGGSKSEVVIAKDSSLSQDITAPETIEEAKSFGEKIFQQLPKAIKRIWKEEVIPLWEKTWVKWWHSFIKPSIQKIWQKILTLFKKRKPIIKEEFEREKKEMKGELPKVKNDLWERFKELWK